MWGAIYCAPTCYLPQSRSTVQLIRGKEPMDKAELLEIMQREIPLATPVNTWNT